MLSIEHSPQMLVDDKEEERLCWHCETWSCTRSFVMLPVTRATEPIKVLLNFFEQVLQPTARRRRVTSSAVDRARTHHREECKFYVQSVLWSWNMCSTKREGTVRRVMTAIKNISRNDWDCCAVYAVWLTVARTDRAQSPSNKEEGER